MCVGACIDACAGTCAGMCVDIPHAQPCCQETHGPLSCTINTFGFGYSLDSPLLGDLANHGGGMYNFIPDSGFVGTVFIKAITI